MIDKYDLWKYSDNSNCWDFVVAFLFDQGVVLPKFGIHPKDKRAMTKASKDVIKKYLVDCEPQQNAIACQYQGKVLVHVGVVDNGLIRHAHEKNGVRKDTQDMFESLAQKTVYKIPRCLLS